MKEDRIERIWSHPKFQKVEKELLEWERERTFCRHGVEHLLDVARIAYILVYEAHKEKEYPKDVVYGAALLHDIGRLRQYKDRTPHEIESARLAKEILKDCGYSKEEIGLMTEGIASHRLIEVEKEENLKGFLYRADKLSRNCPFCLAKKECNWEKEKKNTFLLY